MFKLLIYRTTATISDNSSNITKLLVDKSKDSNRIIGKLFLELHDYKNVFIE